ncbi:MAG: hypothetical protein IJM64_07355 [Ottowia sp.]|nr:hypothetical protein [Ottowia sp.]
MMNFIFRLFLTLNATSFFVVVFLVQKGCSLGHWFPQARIPNLASYVIYAAIPLALTGISIWLIRFLGKDPSEKGGVESIECANNSFLPSYLGYFFVALGITSRETFVFVYILIFVFTFLSQTLYFNPLFLIFGYKFYNVKTKRGASIFLVSKMKYKIPGDIDILNTHRINDYTFIEIEKGC